MEYEAHDPRSRCQRCKANYHCDGNPNNVVRIGEKSHVLNCKCECNDFGKVQGNDKGHVRLTQEIVYKDRFNKMRNKSTRQFINRRKNNKRG